MCARIETATALYKVDILYSESIYQLLCAKARERSRKLDVVMVKGSVAPTPIYTIDFGSADPFPAPDLHQLGELITSGEISKESLYLRGVAMVFEMDLDLTRMQEGITAEFQSAWRQAFSLYISGAWSLAGDQLRKCSNMRAGGDGPSEFILSYIAALDFTAPDDWAGCRKLESK